jgi:hypothetical protein
MTESSFHTVFGSLDDADPDAAINGVAVNVDGHVPPHFKR